MFAAAATLAHMALDISISVARWVSMRLLVVGLLTVILPRVLKGVFIWGFQYIERYGMVMVSHLMSTISQNSGESFDINMQLTGVGGYIANQIGLIDYCTILITNWGLIISISFLIRIGLRK